MAPKTASNVREFSIDVEGLEPFVFHITQSDFGRFLRESQRDVAMATQNMLLTTCDDRERLKLAFDDDWGLPLQIMAPIQEELLGARQVTVKKP